jgi:hypothetical protein
MTKQRAKREIAAKKMKMTEQEQREKLLQKKSEDNRARARKEAATKSK